MTDENFTPIEGTVQIATVPARPECLLVIVPEGLSGTIHLPILTIPFTRTGVREAIGQHSLVSLDHDRCLRARVFETTPGRWASAMTKARNEERSARAQQQRQAELTQAAIMNGSNVPLIRDRAEAVIRKNEIDATLAQLKVEFGRVRADAAVHGRYIEPRRYRAMEERIEGLKAESQALQTRLGELRRQEKRQNIANSDGGNAAFRKTARRMLDPNVFDAIERESRELEGDPK